MTLGPDKNMKLDENMLRYLALNSIRYNIKKFREEFGDDIVIACDSRVNWRKIKFPEYKANRAVNRAKSPLDWDLIFSMFNTIREELKEFFPYRVIHVNGAEADDIIGVLCHKYGVDFGLSEPILIISGDHDFQQLHIYENVKQYSPTLKKWIRNNNPSKYLLEHILSGDSGDGVPNVLSDSDTLVTKTKRQKSLTKIIKAKLLIDLENEDISEWPEEHQLNYKRNKRMVDLKNTPRPIKEKIIEDYDSESGKDRSKVYNYLLDNRLANLLQFVTDF